MSSGQAQLTISYVETLPEDPLRQYGPDGWRWDLTAPKIEEEIGGFAASEDVAREVGQDAAREHGYSSARIVKA